jgi:hypothetical protein
VIVVQALRMLILRSAILLKEYAEARLVIAGADWKRPDTLCTAAGCRHLSRPDLAAEWTCLADAITADPTVPSDNDLMRRFVGGDVSVCAVNESNGSEW